MFDNLTGRVGILYSEPGIGFDYELFNFLGMSIDAYNINEINIDITGRIRLTDSFDISGTIMKDSLSGNYNQYSFGLKYHP